MALPDPPPSICIVSCAFDPEAAEPDALLAQRHAVFQWAEALAAAGSGPVTVVQRACHDARLQRGGVTYDFVADGGPPQIPAWSWAQRVARAVHAAAARVVHVQGLVFPGLTRNLRLSLPRDTALLVQDHGGLHAGSPGFRRRAWRMLYRLGLRAADGFLFTARALAAPWRDARIFAPGAAIYEVIESSTEIAVLPPPAGRPVEAPLPGRPAMLWVGRLDTNKDPFTALDGFTRIAARLPEAQLTMVFAEDLLGGEVQRRVAASTVLRDRVHLRGRVEWRALPALYATADLFLLASHHEGSGFALIEAIAFGVTPVVSDIPAFRAITSGGRDGGGIGALFPIEDAGALAIALERAGAVGPGPDQRREEVKRFFARRLSWAAIARQALAAYTAAAQQRTARPGAAVNP